MKSSGVASELGVSPMDEDRTTKTCKTAVLFTVLLSQTCFANPYIISPRQAISEIGFAVIINFMVDFFVLVAGYTIIKSSYCIQSLEFLKYLLFVVISGFLIDGILDVLRNYYGMNMHYTSISMIIFAFIALSICNLILCRGFFELPYRNATIIGMLMGVFTNPYIYLTVF